MHAGSCCRRLPGEQRPRGLTRCGLTARPSYTMGSVGEEGAGGMWGAGPPSLHGGGTPTAGRVASCCFAFCSLGGVLREDAVAVEDVMVTGLTG